MVFDTKRKHKSVHKNFKRQNVQTRNIIMAEKGGSSEPLEALPLITGLQYTEILCEDQSVMQLRASVY